MSEDGHNATFHAFKPSGKWYTTGRGVLPASVFTPYWDPTTFSTRERILEANGGKFPGLNSSGLDFIWVIVGDESLGHGFPVHLTPEQARGLG